MTEARSSAPLRVLLADEHKLFREGCSRLLGKGLLSGGGAQEELVVVGRGPHGEEAVTLALTEVPGLPGYAQRYLRRLLEACSPDPRIVVVAALEDPRLGPALLAARACLHKGAAAGELLSPIRASSVAPGPHTDAVGSAAADPPLTEREVILLAARGLANRQIACTFCLSEVAVKRHLANAYPEAGARSRTEAAQGARRGLDLGRRGHPGIRPRERHPVRGLAETGGSGSSPSGYTAVRRRAGTGAAKAGAEAKVELVLAPTGGAVPAALAALDGLEERLRAEELQDARLLVAELVSNAVRHAGLNPKDEVRLGVVASPEVVRGEVCDPGTKGFEPARPVPKPGPHRASGWGLYIVERISDRWGVEEREGLGCAWFELDRPRGAARRAYQENRTELRGMLSASVREEAGGRVLVVEASGDVHLATREVLHGALEKASDRAGDARAQSWWT